jgi:hypothetical protein
MTTKFPIRYSLVPKTVDEGQRWITVRLQNLSAEDLTNLEVRLNSIDTWSIYVHGQGDFIPVLRPKEEQEVHFQISANASGRVYITIDGERIEDAFHWESPDISIRVGKPVAELVSLFALSQPRVILGEPITFQATVRGLAPSRNLVIEFWVDTPTGESKSLAKEGLGHLSAREVVQPTVEITPEEEGIYVLHTYLYDGPRRIGHEIEYLSVSL